MAARHEEIAEELRQAIDAEEYAVGNGCSPRQNSLHATASRAAPSGRPSPP